MLRRASEQQLIVYTQARAANYTPFKEKQNKKKKPLQQKRKTAETLHPWTHPARTASSLCVLITLPPPTHTHSVHPTLTLGGEGQPSLQAKVPASLRLCQGSPKSAAGSIKVGMRWWCLWSRARRREMICSALLIEKRGPTCRDPGGAVRVNATAEDFEHGQDHLVKIFTCVLLQG